jgi:hypothetical protein
MNPLIIFIGILSSLLLVISGLSTQRKRMLMFATGTSALVAVQYLMAHSTLALVICFIGIIRNIVAIMAERYPILDKWFFLAGFLAAHTVAFLLTAKWDDFHIINMFPLFGAYVGTVAVFFKRMAITKAMMIACGAIWLSYEFHSGIYGQMVGESFTLVANSIAFITLLVAARKGIPESAVDNVDTHLIETITSSLPVVQEKIRTRAIPVIRQVTESVSTVTSSISTITSSHQVVRED